MSATDKLYFPPTGDETSSYLLVTLFEADGAIKARAEIRQPSPVPEGSEHPPVYEGTAEGDPATVFKEASAFTEMRGYPLRVAKPDDVAFPSELGMYAERRIDE